VTRAAFAVVVALALACKGETKTEAPTPAPPATPAAPAAPAPAPTPAPTPSMPSVPTGSLRGDAARGAQLYATYCATCHGTEGKGDGPAAGPLNPKPANHADHDYMGTLSDEHLYQVISKGGASVGKSPLMAPWGGVINDQGIRDLIAFIRKLSNT
jgi:mono/diheme cytochrome c family protein